jgi:hydrogenase maturation protease
MTTLVVGVGSPFGDDRVGWEVVEALEAGAWWPELAAHRVSAHLCDRPGAALVGLLQVVGRAIIVDAAHTPGIPPGTLRWLQADQLSLLRAPSSHGFGVAEALALASALGQLPPRVDVLTIAAGQFTCAGLSAPVRGAVPDAVSAIRRALVDQAVERRVRNAGEPEPGFRGHWDMPTDS